MNERLILSSIHQHELTEEAEQLNAQLQAEIAQHKLAETALREREIEIKSARDYAEAILRAAPVPFLVLRADLRVNSASEAFYNDFQVERTATEGRLIYRIGNGQWNIPRLRELLEEIIPQKNVFNGFEVTHTFAGIGARTMLLNARRLDSAEGVPERILLAIEDITEQIEAQAIVRASQAHALELAERFRFLAESMPQKIFTAKPNGAIDYLNRQWIEFTGLSLERIRDWGWLQFVHPDDLEENLRRWQHSIDTREPFSIEHRFLRIDGQYRWHITRALPMFDPEGKTLMWIGSNTDIEDLRQAKDRAEFASHAKDEFLAALSHELRTPLTPVLMSAADLQHDDRLPPEVRDQLGMMERNIALEARLIDDLLDLTRIAHGKLSLRTQPCNAHDLIEQAVEMVRSDVQGKRQTMEVDLAAEHSQVMGDPARLQQVFWNLLKNAVKFTPESGRLGVRSHDMEGRLALEISDSGIGISPESIARIFLPFEQVGAAAADHRVGGLGLGLSITKAILDLHGGSIQAESGGLGEGATFRVELPATEQPLDEEKATDGAAGSEEPRAKVAPLRILLVEDHQSTLAVLERLLTRVGHHVTSAISVASALQSADAEIFDVLISDVGLPDGTGYELMEKLRAVRGLRGIALSGYGMDDDLRRSHEAGFRAHLIKPIDFAQLERALAELMAGT